MSAVISGDSSQITDTAPDLLVKMYKCLIARRSHTGHVIGSAVKDAVVRNPILSLDSEIDACLGSGLLIDLIVQ